MSSIHTDQATLDRWLADGRWVQFAPGEPQFSPLHGDTPSHVLPPADWKTGPCETCGGRGFRMLPSSEPCPHCGCEESRLVRTPCSDCKGVQRLAAAVPCHYTAPHLDPSDHGNRWGIFGKSVCPKCFGSNDGHITVAWATVEWGPLPVVEKRREASGDCVVVTGASVFVVTGSTSKWRNFADLPPDIDPQSLVGQWARGGTIEVVA